MYLPSIPAFDFPSDVLQYITCIRRYLCLVFVYIYLFIYLFILFVLPMDM
jgi:hypothetical protein